MRIILFRHGPAERRDGDRWPDDNQRPLTARGIARTRAAARALAHVTSGSPSVLTSPLVRARQTAEILHKALGAETPPRTLDALAPGGSYRDVIRALHEANAGDRVFLVGHEPDLGKLAGVLLFGAPATSLPLKKAGACIIHFVGEVAPGAGQLHDFLAPRVLRVMRTRKLERSKS
jgi:phosphohistidine phosphatase